MEQSDEYKICPYCGEEIKKVVAEVIPSQFIASATYNALLTVLPPCRQFTRKASRKSIGYDLSSGLFCHSFFIMQQLNKVSTLEVVAFCCFGMK